LTRAELLDSEIYRVIVLRQSGSELLLASTEGGFSLPEVIIPRWQRVAGNLSAAMKSGWREEVVCIFQPGLVDLVLANNHIRYQIAEHWRCFGRSEVPTRWLSVEGLRQNSFVDPSDYAVIQRSLAERDTLACDPAAGPFAQLGWFKNLVEWVEEVIAPRGLHLSGNFRQMNASPSFSLIRFETEAPAVWFKAVGAPNRREFPITLTLARLFPNYLPAILAVRSAWNGWLMSEVQGTDLGDTTDSSLWEAAAAAMARVQVESIKSQQQLRRSGARDLRTKALRELVSPFMSLMGQLMGQQSKIPPPVLSKTELKLLGEGVQDALSLVGELGIPDTIGHLDLNPGNIIVSQNGCAFLDWAEAYVGHPFFSFQYLLEHFRRTVAADSISQAKLAASYLAPWEQIASRDCLTAAMSFAPLLAAFAYAVGTDTWKQPETLRDPHFAGYLRSLARRMNSEGNQLSVGRSTCLS
jgi:Phosphotransferase enzyme family